MEADTSNVGSCVVCFESFDEADHLPRLLACGHSFCTRCLDDLAGAPPVPANADPESEPAASAGLVVCPKCRHTTRLPRDLGVIGLPPNFDLLEVLTQSSVAPKPRAQQEEPAGPEPSAAGDARRTCENCANAFSDVYCERCQVHMCAACDGQLHSMPALKPHTRVPVGSMHSGAISCPTCEHHQGKKLKYWCKVDSRPVCTSCLLLGEHKGHEVMSLDEAANTARCRVQRRQVHLAASIVRVEQALAEIDGAEAKGQQNADEQRAAIAKHFTTLRNRLTMIESELDARVQTLAQRKQDSLQKQRKELLTAKAQLDAEALRIQNLVNEVDLRSRGALDSVRILRDAEKGCTLKVHPSMVSVEKSTIVFASSRSLTASLRAGFDVISLTHSPQPKAEETYSSRKRSLPIDPFHEVEGGARRVRNRSAADHLSSALLPASREPQPDYPTRTGVRAEIVVASLDTTTYVKRALMTSNDMVIGRLKNQIDLSEYGCALDLSDCPTANMISRKHIVVTATPTPGAFQVRNFARNVVYLKGRLLVAGEDQVVTLPFGLNFAGITVQFKAPRALRTSKH